VSRRRATAIAALAVLVAAPVEARELSKAARERRDAGLVEYKAGRYDRAIAEFEAAYKLDPEPALLFSLAQAERLGGRCADALDHYERYLESNPNDEQTSAARVGIAWCEGHHAAGTRVVVENRLPWYKDPAAGLVGSGGLVLAVSFGYLLAAKANRDIALTKPTVEDAEPARIRANAQRATGYALFLVGGALVGGGLWYHVHTERRRDAAARPKTSWAFDGSSLYFTRAF
jgi:tetratricopeptide (TPR) repeat protein